MGANSWLSTPVTGGKSIPEIVKNIEHKVENNR